MTFDSKDVPMLQPSVFKPVADFLARYRRFLRNLAMLTTIFLFGPIMGMMASFAVRWIGQIAGVAMVGPEGQDFRVFIVAAGVVVTLAGWIFAAVNLGEEMPSD